MPRIYRAMKRDADGQPVVDDSGRGLGVRIPPRRPADVDLETQGRVLLNGKGMSVSPAWRQLPPHLIPQRLKGLFPRARGSDQLHCFAMGQGGFQDGPLVRGLRLVVTDPDHGHVATEALVLLGDYQADLAATRDSWTIDEG
jgi:hypothetical protein